MVDIIKLEGKNSLKLDLGIKLLRTLDNLNDRLLNANYNEIRAITEGIEDIAFVIKKIYGENGENK